MSKFGLGTVLIVSLLCPLSQTGFGQIAIRPAKPTRRALISPAIQLQVGSDPATASITPSFVAETTNATSMPNENISEVRAKSKETRLKKLSKLTFNRLPSTILETWSQNSPDESETDLPPAPKGAFLYSDERFKIATDQLQKDFTMGNWEAIAAFMRLIPKENAKTVYKQVLLAITGGNIRKLQGASNSSSVDARTLQPQYLSFEDIFTIARISPAELEKSDITQFSLAFRNAISRGTTSEDLVNVFQTELLKDNPVFEKRQMAKILFGANLPIEAGQFLPKLESAKVENDHEALNLLSQHYLAINSKDKNTDQLEKAWHVTQAILASNDVAKIERKTALARAVKLSSQVSEELGKKWLNDSFVAQPKNGMEVLGAIGADTAKSLKTHARSANIRLERLKLQNDAVNALLLASKNQATHWRHPLELLAATWLMEARISYTDDNSTTRGPNMQRDMYGNIFYSNGMVRSPRSMPGSGRVTAIATNELLDIKPSAAWLELIDPTLRPEFDSVLAKLYLKVSEDEAAFPYLESLAKSYPQKVEKLADEYIEVWTRNHDPNNDRRRTNSYMYMYGFESRAESIPLTRSKQQRNLNELSVLAKRLDQLVDKELDEKLLVRAFTTCHSTAEVYKKKDIEKVFGPMEEIKSDTIANLASRMRTNLATMWRDANVQKDKKTKRKKKDIEQEVIEGYEMAQNIIKVALASDPDQWNLINTQAELLHDENNYRSELKNSSEFAPRRKEAMMMFQQAADKYASKVLELDESSYSTKAYESWFYASLGACDLGLITEKHRSDEKQAELIRKALEDLPAKAADWHMSRFANLLFNRMSSAKPQLKHKYLDLGFRIVGDHKQAREAKKVHDYYKDLVNEIQLVTAIDGSSRVGHDQAFGVYVSLRHTKEIERESGGFGRYLQNQNSNMNFSYNYGRPTEDYRDKFEEAVRDAYSEQFEVLSITFEKPEVKSIPGRETGWRITPYAYMLLKARGPEVDMVPPAKLDLDFLDTSGYAILPVASPSLPIDAGEFVSRPFTNLSVTQILDERQSEEGKLIVEIKAQAQGLVPEIESILDLTSSEFNVKEISDQGVSVSQFDPESKKTTINSERTWMVSLEAKPDLPTKPTTFEFPQPTIELSESVFQRYVDADLASVSGIVNLEEKYGKQSYAWIIYPLVGGGLFLILLIGLTIYFMRQPKKEPPKSPLDFDNNLSPFAAISLLQEIHANNGLSDVKKHELAAAITRLESHYFGQPEETSPPDLTGEVKKWAKQSKLAV